MKLVNLIDEDFSNYKKPGMFLGFPYCYGKCNIEAGRVVCQNQTLQNAELIDISPEEIIERYSDNPISQCLICGGLEPFDSYEDLKDLCKKWQRYTADPIIIYTGYYPFEIHEKIKDLFINVTMSRIIIKYGRFIPGHAPHDDPVLGIALASDNQYAESIADTFFKYDLKD